MYLIFKSLQIDLAGHMGESEDERKTVNGRKKEVERES